MAEVDDLDDRFGDGQICKMPFGELTFEHAILLFLVVRQAHLWIVFKMQHDVAGFEVPVHDTLVLDG